MQKYKLNINREKLSDEEIANQINYERFIQSVPSGKGWLLKGIKTAKAYLIAGVAGLAIVGGYLFHNHSKENRSILFIDPPFNEARIEYASYDINPERDTTIIYKTGSTINIPSHAFVDKDGKTEDGLIQIRYREFHDLYEIILSGIPMSYDSAGTQYQFESAGMFEVQAFKGNEPLSIDTESSLRVNMISHTADDKFNTYFLDTNKRCWNYISANTKENNTVIPLCDSNVVKKYEEKLNNLNEPIRLLKANSKRFCFTIDYNKEEFPDLALYDGVKFEVDKNDKTYNPKLSAKTWEDASIEKKENGRYAVIFSTGNESHSFNVVPVIDGKDYEKAQMEFEEKMKDYTMALNSRKDKKKLNEEIIRANYQKYIYQAKWEDVTTRVNNFLKCDYVHYERLAMRTFDIYSTGTWNSDCPYQIENEGIVNATFYDQDKKPLIADKVYLIIKNNGVSYRYPIIESQIEKFKFDAKHDCMLLAITVDGFPASLNAEEFKKAVKKSNKVEFIMHVSDKKIKTPEELKKLFNI